MWQTLFDEIKSQNITIVSIANDSAAAARPWIEAAKATYPCLIDADHYVTDLYHFVNVPQSVWIDEQGTIVRPPGSGGSNDSFRAMDRVTGTMSEEIAAQRAQTKAQFINAVRDWARHGAASRYVLDTAQANDRLRLPTADTALAHALFRLGRYLDRRGEHGEARALFARAIELHPDSWSMWRQTATKDSRGFAAGPDFWARVDALGSRLYHQPFQ